MKAWSEFLNEAPPHNNRPGEVMVAFLNRFMCPATSLRFKLIMEGQAIEGEVDDSHTGVRLKPATTQPIEVYVWSRDRQAFKRLEPDVHPVLNKNGRARCFRKSTRDLEPAI